ncbi:MAG TPA: ATPase, T2SS/T4P/T4SS family [Gaiellaceae bacterium]
MVESHADLPTPLPLRLAAEGTWRVPLGSLLLRDDAITTEQLEAALTEKDVTGRRIGEIVVSRGWVQAGVVAKLLAEQHGLEYLDLTTSQIDPHAAELLPEKYARRYEALPVRFIREDLVLVTVADPTNVLASDDLKLTLGVNVQLAVSAAPDVAAAIDRFHAQSVSVAEGEHDSVADLDDVRSIAASAPAINSVNSLVARAIAERASDLHFEAEAGHMVVRARIDGVMRNFTTIPHSLQPAVTSRLKVMAELDIAERRAPQDGRMTIRYGGHPMDIRVAVLPTTHGEQIVLRILNRPGALLGLGELGMGPGAEDRFARAIRQPYGAVLAVGPTGSGKTTTLYAALDILNEAERVLMTIEDPVEYQMPGVNQIEVNFKSGLTFARGLRTILRSDPDVLLVGEIRDEETARIAIQAAMTGHLVLTTLHAHNASASIARLVDMGAEPSLLATSINCIVAQRLARRLCENCREAYEPNDAELAEIGIADFGRETTLYRPVGCVQCAGTGFVGRVALYEVLPVQGRMRRLIESGSTDEIFAEAVAEGMTTLREDGLRLAATGLSSLDEIRRVTGDRLS